MSTTLGWHWETTVTGRSLDEVKQNAQAEMDRFFDGFQHGYIMEIDPGETMAVRDGGGALVGYEVAYYTARVRVTYTNYEAQS